MPPIEEELGKEIRKFATFCDYSYVNSTGELSRKMSKFNFMFDE